MFGRCGKLRERLAAIKMAADGTDIPNENLDTAHEEGGDDEVGIWLPLFSMGDLIKLPCFGYEAFAAVLYKFR